MQPLTKLSTVLASAAAVAVSGLALAGDCGSGVKQTRTVTTDDHGNKVVVINNYVNADRDNELNLFATAFTNENLTTLAGLVATADLDEALSGGEFTVFAPTNDAFTEIPADTRVELLNADNKEQLQSILTYHVVEGTITASDIKQGEQTVTTLAGEPLLIVKRGNNITVNGRDVVLADVGASNGVAHVIDGVLLPGSEQAQQAAAFEEQSRSKSIAELAAGSEDLETLLAAVKAAGFARSLSEDGPYTVFAPTDEAFAELGDTVDRLLRPGNVEDLRGVLRLHILAGKVDARDAVVKTRATGRVGAELRFEIENGQLFVVGPNNRAKVIATDLDANNGIVHVIDTVLIPSMNRFPSLDSDNANARSH